VEDAYDGAIRLRGPQVLRRYAGASRRIAGGGAWLAGGDPRHVRSGKTTLLRVIAGFEPADAGTIELGGQVVDSAQSRGRVPPERRHIGFVPQDGALFPHLTVHGNVAFGLPRSARHGPFVDELLELVGLSALCGRYPHELSGCQQQRVAIARALAPRPRLVLLDEPFASLDASLRAVVRAEVLGALRAVGTTGVLVTHDQDEALSVADYVAVLGTA
jgi:iron(III) transport system ATP-binding protein